MTLMDKVLSLTFNLRNLIDKIGNNYTISRQEDTTEEVILKEQLLIAYS